MMFWHKKTIKAIKKFKNNNHKIIRLFQWTSKVKPSPVFYAASLSSLYGYFRGLEFFSMTTKQWKIRAI